MTREELEKQVLGLPPQDRARLAERLLESLESLSEAEVAELWLEEAARRKTQLESRPSLLRPAIEAIKDARAKLR